MGMDDKSEEGWIRLFNGENLDGWIIKISGHKLNKNYNNTFRVKDGVLKVSYDNYKKFNGEFGHIFYKTPFSQYILRLEYRFIGEQTPGGPGWGFRNSGIMLHCQNPESMSTNQNFPLSIELQLLGGNGVDERSTANVCTPGTHLVMENKLVTKHCTNSKSKTYHGDQWVNVEVEVRGNTKITHIVNGEVVLEYGNPQLDEEDSFIWETIDMDDKELINNKKLLHEGYISLQAESHPVEFRNIEILPLVK